MSIKDKLLAAIDSVDLNYIGEEALLDILVARIKGLEAENSAIRGENAHERLMLNSRSQQLEKDIRDVRHNPCYLATGQYYFLGTKGEKIDVVIARGSIQSLCAHYKTAKFPLMQVSYAEFQEHKCAK